MAPRPFGVDERPEPIGSLAELVEVGGSVGEVAAVEDPDIG